MIFFFPLHTIRVFGVTRNHAKISSFTWVWICISSSSVTVIFKSLSLLSPLFKLFGNFSAFPSCFGRWRGWDLWGERAGEEKEERKRDERKREKVEEEQGWQARMCGKALSQSNPNTPAVECALNCPVSRILFRLFPLPKVASSFPQFSSVLFSDSVVSSSLQPHGLQHARFPCP